MATLLLTEGSQAPATQIGTATLVLVLSPVRGVDGQFHVQRTAVDAGHTIQQILPASDVPWEKVCWNGGVVAPASHDLIVLQPGDEVWLWPAWGLIGGTLGSLILYAAIGIAVSAATSALTYVLFPPQKPHLTPPDEHTFSFSGIQTAVGPGNVVPVIYGRHRVGGQLLAAAVDQALTVIDTGAAITQVQAVTTPPTLNMLIALGEGEVDNILWGTVEMNGQPLDNFQGVELYDRRGFTPQTAIANFNEVRNTFPDGRELPDNSANTGANIVYTTNTRVTAFVLNIAFNQGLFQVNGKGEKEDNSVTITYQYKPHSSSTWSPFLQFRVSAQRTAPVRFGIRRENLTLDTYDISINYGAPRHNDDLHAKWVPTLESVTQCQNNTQTYDGTAILALRAVATDALQGNLPNLTVEVRGKKVRVGTFSTGGEVWSDNPAWCVMDFMTNSRYGLGIPDEEMDLAAFQAWADYCDEDRGGEQRHRLNYVLDRDMRAQAVLLEMMGGSRTILLKSEGLWTPRPTRNSAPVQLLSATNCANLKITYTRDSDRVNVMEARYSNEEDHFDQDVMTWPEVDNWPAEVHKASLDIRGVTKPSRIQRALQFELNRRRFENCLLEMDCSLDAVVLQVHDVFRFSHPLPGWGASGRVESSNTDTIILDTPVTMDPGQNYHLYLKHANDYTEVRPLVNSGTTTTVVHAAIPFDFAPASRDALWAFGLSDPDTAVRFFRVTKLQRKSDTTVHLEAVVHNPTIYDEPEASPITTPPGLFNPLGPPPPLQTLVATELVRITASGASAHVANLSWDVAPLGARYAPYGGAQILRRVIQDSGSAGNFESGTSDMGALQNDANLNFSTIITLHGHIVDYDDATVLSGASYVYRVVPISERSVPNQPGALETTIAMSGATGPDYFPGTVANLRLLGQAVGVTTWEGRDVHLQWDPVPDPGGLFNNTFFVVDYLVQVWAPAQQYILRGISTTALQFHYTFEMNIEDQAHVGLAGARRDLMLFVWARTNTGRISLNPAYITVNNPPPDMSVIDLDTTALFEAAKISWDQYREPRDFDHYELHVDTMNPPIAIYQDLAVSGHGQGSSFRVVNPTGLQAGVEYWTYVLPYDSFGAGIPTETESFIPGSISSGQLDETPPGKPTGLVLTTGTETNPDGTITTWVEAHWNANPESDVGSYEVHFAVIVGGVEQPPSVYTPDRSQRTIRIPVPGGVTVRVKLYARDRTQNVSEPSDSADISTGKDTVPPAAPTNLSCFGSIKSVALLWTPPPDLDYAYAQVWVSQTNDRRGAVMVGSGLHSFVHDSMGANDTRYYWLRSVDTSGNVSVDFYPASVTAGVVGTAGTLDTTYIENLAANKITAGTIAAKVDISVADRLSLDGVNAAIVVKDLNERVRIIMGRLGSLQSQWGLNIFDETGALQWHFATGATTAGINDRAVNASKIAVGSISAEHCVTDVLLVTGTAQIADAIITDAKITNLTASKIMTGVLTAFYYLGSLGRIQLDGINLGITVYDDNNQLRCLLGRTFPATDGYGLNIWDGAGNIMWSFSSGASTFGIQDAAITRAKIGFAAIGSAQIDNLAVQNAHIENLTVGTQKIANNAISASILFAGGGGGVVTTGDTLYAAVTLTLAAGDQVLLIGCCTAVGAGAGGASTGLFLREDGFSGTVRHQADARHTDAASDAINMLSSLTVQDVYVSPSAQTKIFVLTSRGAGSVRDVRLAAFQLKK